MKKIFLSILMICFLFTLCACNSNNSDINDNKQEVAKKFDDLTMIRMIGSFDDVWIGLPNWREDGSETCTVVEYQNYYIIAVISKEDSSFDELFNNTVKSDLRHFVDRGSYEDFTPETKEEVLLSNRIQTIRFDGTLRLEEYGDKYEYPVYGYYLNFNNYSIMIMSTETGSFLNSDEQRRVTNKYVDEIIQTIRNSK